MHFARATVPAVFITATGLLSCYSLQQKDQHDFTQSPVYRMIHGMDSQKPRSHPRPAPTTEGNYPGAVQGCTESGSTTASIPQVQHGVLSSSPVGNSLINGCSDDEIVVLFSSAAESSASPRSHVCDLQHGVCCCCCLSERRACACTRQDQDHQSDPGSSQTSHTTRDAGHCSPSGSSSRLGTAGGVKHGVSFRVLQWLTHTEIDGQQEQEGYLSGSGGHGPMPASTGHLGSCYTPGNVHLKLSRGLARQWTANGIFHAALCPDMHCDR